MRYLIYLLAADNDAFHDDAVEALRTLRDRFDTIHVVTREALTPDQQARLDQVDKIQHVPDALPGLGPYRSALLSNDQAFYEPYRELVLLDGDCRFSPGFADSFQSWAEEEGDDFWAASALPPETPNPFTGQGELPGHLQALWIGFGAKILADDRFYAWWRDLATPETPGAAMTQEADLTQRFQDLGFRQSSFLQLALLDRRREQVLAELRRSAFDDGWRGGSEAAWSSGFDDGFEKGRDARESEIAEEIAQAFENGHAEGHAVAETEVAAAHESGFEAGVESARSELKAEFDKGFAAGFKDGWAKSAAKRQTTPVDGNPAPAD